MYYFSLLKIAAVNTYFLYLFNIGIYFSHIFLFCFPALFMCYKGNKAE